MAPNAQKRQCSPSESRPTKKAKGKTDTSVRRSDRSGKGIGGAVEQLRKAGDAVASQSKRGFDAFEDAGEGLNPMAPESPTRKSKKSKQLAAVDNAKGRSRDVGYPLAKLAAPKKGDRFGFKLPPPVPARGEPASRQQASESNIRPNTVAAGWKIIMDERQRQEQKKKETHAVAHETSRNSKRNKAKTPEAVPDDESNEDKDDDDGFGSKEDESEHESKDEENELSYPSSESEKQPSREGSDSEEDLGLGQDNFPDDAMDFGGEQRNVKKRQRNDTNRERTGADGFQDGFQDTDVVDEHHATNDVDVLDEYYTKNRRPQPPNASDLAAVRGRNNRSTNADDNESDTSIKLRNKRYSKTPKTAQSTSPTQIGFYPPKWKDFLEECKVETRTYAAISDPWPHRRQLLNGFILDTINMTVVRWKREERSVEKGFYPKHKKAMGELLFDDLASWRGEIKKAASNAVRAHYDLFPSKDSNFSKVQTRNHVKEIATELIKKSSFAHGSKDEEDHTDNFGHPAIRELLHVFLYGRDNRIGNLRAAEFGHIIPNGTLSLAITAIRCILNGYKIYGKPKFPTFTRSNYRPKWNKFLDLIKQLEKDRVHGPKLDRMCREIAQSGIMGGSGGDDASDADIASGDEFGIVLD